jgi:hypothetical protein
MLGCQAEKAPARIDPARGPLSPRRPSQSEELILT